MLNFLINLDHKLFILINQTLSSHWLDGLMHVLSSKAAFIPIYIIVFLKFVQLYKKKFWVPVLLCVLAVGLSDSISSKICKPLFKRTRPAFCATMNPRLPDGKPGSKYGFVSSHSANAFAVYPLFVVLVFGDLNKFKTRRKFVITALVLACLVGFSRVYNGAHWPADVLGGAILGYLIFLFVVRIWENKLSAFALKN
jgi:undecaprenyl-diphosphatase